MKPSYEELEARVAELEHELGHRHPSAAGSRGDTAGIVPQTNQIHSNDLTFLSAATTDFFNTAQDQNLFRVIGRRLQAITGDAIVAINSYNHRTNLFQAEFVEGIGRYADKVLRLLNRDPVGMTVELNDPRAIEALRTGKMEVGPRDIYELCFGAIPRSVCHAIEKLLNIGPIYVLGFVYRERLFGDVIIITRRGRNEQKIAANKLLIETFTLQAAIALQRKQFEDALRESEAKYKNIVQYAPAGIYEFDIPAMRFTSVNDVMCQYTGYSQSEFLDLDPFTILSENSKKILTQNIERVFKNQLPEIAIEVKITGKNSQEIRVLTNAKIFYENDVPVRAMVVAHDLTEIRRAEQERRDLEIQLQNARKLESLGTLAGGVAHDLNNILSGIVSYPDLLLLDIEDDSPLREPLLAIKKSGERAAEIVQDLLTLARRNVAVKKTVSLNQIIKDFILSPEYHQIIGDRSDLTLEMKLSDDLLNIAGSGTHLSKTVMNLVANAVDAMPAGGNLTVASRNCYFDQPYKGFERIPQGEYAAIDISDGGIGMPMSDLEKIFDPFYTKKVLGRSGTGLGMAVVWGTIKDHEGFIDIITAEGSGTTFKLYFPVSREEIDASPTVYIDEYLARGESILIVDDAREQRDLASRMMQRLGYDITTAASGKEALALIREKSFDILILDMVMPPGMDGLETYRQIRELVPDQKAVIASGYAATDRVQEAQRIGAGAYVRKPFTLEKIGLAVRGELNK